MKFFERYQIWLHGVGWAVFISLPLLTLPDFLLNRQDIISLGMAQLLTSVLTMAFFYVNLRKLTPALLVQHNTRRFILAVGLMLVSVVLVKVICFYVFPPAVSVPPGPPPPNWTGYGLRVPGPRAGNGPGARSPWPGVPGTVVSLGIVLLVSSLMALFRYHTHSQEEQQRMVLEKVSAELAMLKLQVSPHFLFNTLNNIRWLARRKSDQTEAAVVTLAQLLRYMLYQAQQDTVPLRKEVQHLQDYIDLQTMRLTDIHTVAFNCTGDIDAHQIEPLLFIPFVENAFKYGIQSQQPGHIQIDLNVTSDRLTFSTQNPVVDEMTMPPVSDSPEDSGIGVSNVQKRLALHYPNRHSLTMTNQNGLFHLRLTLLFHHDKVALHRH